MKNATGYTAGLLFAAAILAWGGVWYFMSAVQGAATVQAERVQLSRQMFTEESSSVRTHAIAIDTALERGQLNALIEKDIVEIAALLRGVGRTTGITVTLGGAVPENAPPTSSGQVPVHTVGFALEADGSFSSLMRTLELIETLPLASRIERLDMLRVTGAGAPRWHMSVYIRVLTTASNSS